MLFCKFCIYLSYDGKRDEGMFTSVVLSFKISSNLCISPQAYFSRQCYIVKDRCLFFCASNDNLVFKPFILLL